MKCRRCHKAPNELNWISKEGYECWIIIHLELGHRCGYVKVDKENITNEISSYGDVPVSVHGGLTYGGNGTWGFDTAHLNDTPERWSLEAVKKEVERLSEQLSSITWEKIIESKLEYMPDWFKERIKIKEKNEK